jgi:iron(III) transport system ATP-binding protein
MSNNAQSTVDSAGDSPVESRSEPTAGGGSRPDSDDPVLELDGLRKSYGTETVVQGLSLSVREGEILTLLGPSGCGKTTTLRLIAGLERPDGGDVRLNGESMSGSSFVAPEDRGVGVVFQEFALFPHLTARENVAFGLKDRPDDEVEERVDELLELVDLAGQGDSYPDQLSGGQQQRVALARSLAPEPDILLLDEPFSNLDVDLRVEMREEVREIIKRTGVTAVSVTHDQEEALSISDRVAVMNDGRIEQVGTPETVYRTPETRFVAEFVGDNNLLSGVVEASDPPAVSVDGTRIELADATAAAGESVTLSIRPEAITVDPADATTTLAASVETVEFLGDAYRLHCRWGDRTLLAKTTATSPPSGDVTLGIDPAAVTVLPEAYDV